MTMTIKFIITGGTIDDLEYELAKDAPKKHKLISPRYTELVGKRKNNREVF